MVDEVELEVGGVNELKEAGGVDFGAEMLANVKVEGVGIEEMVVDAVNGGCVCEGEINPLN